MLETLTDRREQVGDLTLDGLGNVLEVGHDALEDVGRPCPFHNPRITALVLAPIRYTAAFGLVRVCQHDQEHPDADWMERQREETPVAVRAIHAVHDRTCDGCCVDAAPVAKPDDPGSHRADTGLLSVAALREVQERAVADDVPSVTDVQPIPTAPIHVAPDHPSSLSGFGIQSGPPQAPIFVVPPAPVRPELEGK
jgi:hypothetical protein